MNHEIWVIAIFSLFAIGVLFYGIIRLISFVLVIRNRMKEHQEENFERRNN